MLLIKTKLQNIDVHKDTQDCICIQAVSSNYIEDIANRKYSWLNFICNGRDDDDNPPQFTLPISQTWFSREMAQILLHWVAEGNEESREISIRYD